jgi:hypothetical protein
MALDNLTGHNLNCRANREEDPFCVLAAHVIITAYKDLHARNHESRHYAELFFENKWFRPWAALAHLEEDVILRGYHRVKEHGMPKYNGSHVAPNRKEDV